MMSYSRRAGFTLIELVVLLAVVAILLALLLPLLLRGREAARRSVCMNNQKQVCLSLQQYEAAQAELPGYVNRLRVKETDKPVVCAWVVPILPYLERADLYRS